MDCATCGPLRPAPTGGTIPANYCHRHDDRTQPATLSTIYCRTRLGAALLAARLNLAARGHAHYVWARYGTYVQYD